MDSETSSSGWLSYMVGYICMPERNGNGTKVAVVAYLDCIHKLVSIIFIVFIRNTRLLGASAYACMHACYSG